MPITKEGHQRRESQRPLTDITISVASTRSSSSLGVSSKPASVAKENG